MGDLGKALPYGARRIRHGPWRDSHEAASFPVRSDATSMALSTRGCRREAVTRFRARSDGQGKEGRKGESLSRQTAARDF